MSCYLDFHDSGILSKHDFLSRCTAGGVQHTHALEQSHILGRRISTVRVKGIANIVKGKHWCAHKSITVMLWTLFGCKNYSALLCYISDRHISKVFNKSKTIPTKKKTFEHYLRMASTPLLMHHTPSSFSFAWLASSYPLPLKIAY